jgi:4-alpha-glucanotransferase
MTLVFRLNYHSSFGQDLWLKYSTHTAAGGVTFEQCVPMRWINEQQWEIHIDVRGTGVVEMQYSYQLRQDFNGVELDEWLAPRRVNLNLNAHDQVRLEDTWCSAGTEDYALETHAFLSILPRRGPFTEDAVTDWGSHVFQLRMAGVKPGMQPCLIGNCAALGNWDWLAAVPLVEVSPNLWRATLEMPATHDIEYKYGIYDPELRRAVRLEAGANRKLAAHESAARQWTRVSDEHYQREHGSLPRGAGVAIPVFSLRSEMSLGVGEFADLKALGDWAQTVNLKLIQILPINDTTSSHDWRDSYPYSAISVFALHPLYLRIDDLEYKMPASFTAELDTARVTLNALNQVDYEAVMKVKIHLSREIFAKHHKAIIRGSRFERFLDINREWAVPYAVFCVKRDFFGTADFSQWQDWAVFDRQQVDALMDPAHPEFLAVAYAIWLQSELDHQLSTAVLHLHAKGLALKGDLPIGINRQSVDAWAAPHLFKMNAQAGAPPDAFAIKGQNWGFPTYHWEVMRQDDFAWWRSRFAQLSRYFDAYRIDHILGFFRIWQVPYEQVEGIMGFFDPALPIPLDEIRARGIRFDLQRYCRPYLRDHFLEERFGDAVAEVKERYLDDSGSGFWSLREFIGTQRKILEHFQHEPQTERSERIRTGLMDTVSDVLFFEVAGSQGSLFHPRCNLQTTKSYQELDADARWRVEQLYADYFYSRQEDFWQAQGYQKLPAMRRASQMLLCGEDLGMVPACVPGVLRELGILSLEIQRMPKTSNAEFSNPADAPYMSVVSPSTHDMTTLRAWWREDYHCTSRFAWQMLGISHPDPELSGELATRIIWQHLDSPAMWAVFPLQDLLAMDEDLRHPQPEFERINVPAIMPYYWRYRTHLSLEQLRTSHAFNARLQALITESRRTMA